MQYSLRTMKNIDIRTGALAPLLVKLSLPVLAGQVFALLYNLVDTFFIARIDTSNPWLVGATGLVFPLYFIFMAASFGITGGVSSLVARAIGAGRTEELDKTAESGIFLSLAASFICLGFMYPLGDPLLRLFGGSNELLAYGKQYLWWVLPTVPFMMFNAVFTGILQGEGRTKHMMVSMMIGTIVNIVMDPVLIFGAKMGIGGAGLATVIGNASSSVYLLVVFLTRKSTVKIHWKTSNISFPVMGEIIRVGLPQSIMNFLASISFIFYNRIMVSINPMIITAFTLYSRLEQLALIPIWAVSSALSSIAGQAAGAGDFKRMKDSSRVSSLLCFGVCGVLFFVFVISSSRLFGVFQSDPQVLLLASQIVLWMALASYLAIPVFMANTIMSVAGFANRSLIFTIIRIYGLNVPACILGAYVIGKNLSSTMVAIFVSSVITVIMYLIIEKRFFSSLEKGTLHISVLKKDEVPAQK